MSRTPVLLMAVVLSISATVSMSLPAAELPLEEGEASIFLANADGSDMKRLADLPQYSLQGSPTWSADSKQIAFDAYQAGGTSDRTRVVVVNADGSSLRVLIDGAMPSFPRAVIELPSLATAITAACGS